MLKCRGCRLQNINPQLYNLLNQLTDLDLGNNQVIYFDSVALHSWICLFKLPHIYLITQGRSGGWHGLNDLSIMSHVKINAGITPSAFFLTHGMGEIYAYSNKSSLFNVVDVSAFVLLIILIFYYIDDEKSQYNVSMHDDEIQFPYTLISSTRERRRRKSSFYVISFFMFVLYNSPQAIFCVLISNKLCVADMEQRHGKNFASKLSQDE